MRLARVVDLSDFDVLAEAGITEVELAADDLAACQKVGGAVRWLGNDGLLVPSARAEGSNLVVYPSNDYDFEVVGSETIT